MSREQFHQRLQKCLDQKSWEVGDLFDHLVRHQKRVITLNSLHLLAQGRVPPENPDQVKAIADAAGCPRSYLLEATHWTQDFAEEYAKERWASLPNMPYSIEVALRYISQSLTHMHRNQPPDQIKAQVDIAIDGLYQPGEESLTAECDICGDWVTGIRCRRGHIQGQLD